MALTEVPPGGDKPPEKPPNFMQRVSEIYDGITKRASDIVQGVPYSNIFFGPGQPYRPAGPDNEIGRSLDYATNYNVNLQPRAYEGVSFPELRMLAEFHDITRLMIETRKDQVEALNWTIKPSYEAKDSGEKQDMIERAALTQSFFEYPDGKTSFSQWTRQLMEDILVIDAPSIWVDRDDPLNTQFKIIDGATLKLVIDEDGRQPEPPSPAFQQIIKGMPAWNYTADDLIYMPRNPRPGRIYGMSPVQQIIITVNICLRRQASQLQYFTDGNIPDALISTPESWTPEQIIAYQKAWDSIMEGQTGNRRRAKFVPGGVSMTQTKEALLKDVFDEWLLKICAFAFSIPASAFIQQVNRATAQTVKAAAEEEGLAPLLRHLKRIFDVIIQKHLKQYDLEFDWADKEETDASEKAAIHDTKIRNGTLTINEARAEDGRDPVEGGDVPIVMTSSGPVPVASFSNLPTEPPPAPQDDPNNPLHPDHPDNPANKDKQEQQASGENNGKKPPGNGAKKPSQNGGTGKSALPFVVAPIRLRKGDSKPLYVRRPLLNAGEIIEHFKEQGFATLLEAHDMHVTQIYSKAPVDWDTFSRHTNQIVVGNGRRSLDQFGDATVFKFESVKLLSRFRQFTDGGCSFDYDQYQPHITLTYADHGLNLDAIEPWRDDLVLGPEIFEKPEGGWADDLVEKAEGWNEEDHPRDEHGRFAGGGGQNKESEKPRASAETIESTYFQMSELTRDEQRGLFLFTEQDVAMMLASAKHPPARIGKASRPAHKHWSDPIGHAQGTKSENTVRTVVHRALKKLAPLAAREISLAIKARAKKAARPGLAKADPPDEEASDELYDLVIHYIDPGDAQNITAEVDLTELDQLAHGQLPSAIADLTQSTGNAALVRLGISDDTMFNQLNENALDFANDRAAEMVGKKWVNGELVDNPDAEWAITDGTRAILQDQVVSAITNGLSVQELQDQIENGLGFSEYRASMIARTESIRAANQGTLEGYRVARDNGLNVQKQWLTAPDACDDCVDNEDDGPIDLDDEFASGDDAPPAHPNCRCTLITNLGDEEGDGTDDSGDDSSDEQDSGE